MGSFAAKTTTSTPAPPSTCRASSPDAPYVAVRRAAVCPSVCRNPSINAGTVFRRLVAAATTSSRSSALRPQLAAMSSAGISARTIRLLCILIAEAAAITELGFYLRAPRGASSTEEPELDRGALAAVLGDDAGKLFYGRVHVPEEQAHLVRPDAVVHLDVARVVEETLVPDGLHVIEIDRWIVCTD